MDAKTQAPLTAAELDALREVARAATQEEWSVEPWGETDILGIMNIGVQGTGSTFRELVEQEVNNAAYIAAFDPPTALRLLAQARRALEAERALDEINGILNEPKRGMEDCGCLRCEEFKHEAGDLTCEDCGYVGPFKAVECACYDYHCVGGQGARGAGCFHGALACPICDGDPDLHAWILAIRAKLASRALAAAGTPAGRGER